MLQKVNGKYGLVKVITLAFKKKTYHSFSLP